MTLIPVAYAASNYAPYCFHIRCYQIMQLTFVEGSWSEVHYPFRRCHRGRVPLVPQLVLHQFQKETVYHVLRLVRYELMLNDGLANFLLRIWLMCTSIRLLFHFGCQRRGSSIPKRSERHIMGSLSCDKLQRIHSDYAKRHHWYGFNLLFVPSTKAGLAGFSYLFGHRWAVRFKMESYLTYLTFRV